MGARRHGQVGALSPGNVKCFVTVKRSVDQLFKHYFHNFWRVEVVHLVVLACVLRAMTKKRSSTFSGKKCTPEKILAMPMNLLIPEKKSCGLPWKAGTWAL